MQIKKILFTAIHLRPVQIFGRVAFRLSNPKPGLQSLNIRKFKKLLFPSLKKQSILSSSSFVYLNERHDLTGPQMWNNSDVSKLWLYNMHYFDDLNASDFQNRTELHKELISRWIKENPIGRGVGWEPYPISLRIINWIKWYFNNNELPPEAIHSLAVQARFLLKKLEYHLLANHLFTNAKALLFAGLFFEGREAECWIKKGLSILQKEIPEQILADGGNFERSPMYHAIMLEDMLDLISIAQTYQHSLFPDTILSDWKNICQKMLYWLKAMCHGDRNISLFNDAAFSIAPEYEMLAEYAQNLQITPLPHQDKVIDLDQTGYISISNNSYKIIIDAGAVGPVYQPGHAHADTLSFELSKENHRLIVNSGTSCYGTGAERLRQRGTAAHNTVTVDGLDSSEVWGGFRVARRAKIKQRFIEESTNNVIITASHDGFCRIKGVGNHKRIWNCEESKITIIDTIDGIGEHCVNSFIHFQTDIKISLINNVLSGTFAGISCIKLCIDNNLESCIEDSTYHPEFGVSLKNKKLTMTFNGCLPITFKTIIEL